MLGRISLELDNLNQASGYFQKALPIFQQVQNLQREAETTLAIAATFLRDKKLHEAQEMLEKALTQFELLGSQYVPMISGVLDKVHSQLQKR